MHFFSEGLTKIRSGNFDATGFLESACGPMAGTFQSLLNDPDSSKLLCMKTATAEDGSAKASSIIEAEVTRAVWGDFVDRCSWHFQFGDSGLEKKLIDRRAELAKEIQTARDAKNTNVDTGPLETLRAELEQDILAIRNQTKLAQSLLKSHVDELDDWLAINRLELIEHYSTADRTRQFLRDGETGPQIAQDVESIRKQISELRLKRKKKIRAWAGEVNAIWSSLELSINDLALKSQRDRAPLVLHRPHDQPGSTIHWINMILPWFDLTVGVLLMLGLFPRLAAMAGGLFLASVIATQPPWVPGATSTVYQAVEMLALFVLASGITTTVPGLGWLIPGLKRRSQPAGSMTVPASAAS